MSTSPGSRPIEEQKADQADKDVPAEEVPKGWPHENIEDLEEGERDTLLKQAGPVGEAARQAWQQYQEDQAREAAGGVAPVNVHTPEGAGNPPADDEDDDEEEDEDDVPESGAASERAAASVKATAKGLEIRDYGTSGEWRVYDPATGRQVARSTLDE